MLHICVCVCVRQELAASVGRSPPVSLDDAMVWARDNFAVTICHVKRQKTGNSTISTFISLGMNVCW